jgi:hypothetical protein
MNTDDLFGQLDPPPGGAERFARRLDDVAAHASQDAHRRRFALAGAAAAAILLVVALAVLRAPSDAPPPPVADSVPAPEIYPEIYESPAFDRLLGRPLRAERLTATVNQQAAAVTELESQNPNVRIYRIH